MFNELGPEDRMRLMRFVCAFAWADLDVDAQEKDFVRRLVHGLELTDDERRQVEEWLTRPPAPEDVDPQDIPPEHIDLFLIAVKALVATDGRITSREAESLRLLEQMLTGNDRTEEWGPPPMTEELDMGE